MIPDYVQARLRRLPGEDCRVVQGSTPVIAFGDPTTSRAATLGLNPSKLEFLDAQGNELDERQRRFETLHSLGIPGLASASLEDLRAVIAACNNYFRRNPYRAWFDQLDNVLQAVGASYYDATACHLDLVQWATDPKWNDLASETRRRLIREDSGFFLDQLRRESIRLLLLNGSGVIREVQRSMGKPLREQSVPITVRTVTTRFFAGRIEEVEVIGWSTNLQSSFGVTNELRDKIADRVSTLTNA